MTDGIARPLRVLAIHRYYWPDTAPYGIILRTIVRHWAKSGYHVSILSTQPSYGARFAGSPRPRVEQDQGVQVRRVRLLDEKGRGAAARLLNIALWAGAILFNVLRNREADVVMVATTPPVIAAAAARWGARLINARLVYHCMDIHPEAGRLSGEFRNPFVFRLLQRIDAANCRFAARTVVLSDDMRASILARPATDAARIAVINNFDASDRDAETESGAALPAKPGSRLRIIFAGNIGRFQGLHTVFDAMLSLEETLDVELIFVGEGALLEELQRKAETAPTDRIKFVPRQEIGTVRRLIRQSDFCLVSLAPEVSRYAYPSKTMTYLAEGRPIIACVEQSSSLAHTIRTEEIGLSVPPADSGALATSIRQLATDSDLRARLQRRAASVGPSLFDRRRILRRWNELLSELCA